MPLPTHLLIHTVSRIRPSSSTDAHNNTTYDYDVPPATSTSLTGRMEQNKAAEPRSDGRLSSERNWTFFTNESDIVATDRIVFGSLTFDVDGPPAPTYDGSGFHHLEVSLRLFEG